LTGDISARYPAPVIGDGRRNVNEKGFGRRVVLALGAMLIAGAFAFSAAPGAAADDPCLPENGCIPGEVAPPVPPDQAGNPQAVTIEATQIPDVPPAVMIDLGLPAPPKHKKCTHKRKHAAASKKCKKKRHRGPSARAAADDPCLPENGCVPPVVAPPVPPDQFVDPDSVSLGGTQLAPAAPYVDVPMPVYPAPKPCRAKGKAKKHRAKNSAHKKCKKKKRHRAK
jgi:hypothetical protein